MDIKTDPFCLDGKRVVILGGTGHLGSAFTEGVLKAGADVLCLARNREKLQALKFDLEEFGERMQIASCDFHDEKTIQLKITEFEDKFGCTNALVNNAYQSAGSPIFLESGINEINDSLKFLSSTIVNTQFMVKRMISNGIEGSIINISSMYGLVSPKPFVYDGMNQFGNPPVYGAIKAGIIQFTRYAAIHLATRNIRVNSISPGAFPRETTENSEFIKRLENEIPNGRIGKPVELVSSLIYLISDASSYVTGTNLVVDGGWTAW